MDFTLGFWDPSLAPSLAESANDPRIVRWLNEGFPSPYELDDAERFISMVKCDDVSLERAIVINGKAVGGIGLTEKRGAMRYCAELGYWLNPAYWGKGIMTRAVRVFCKEMFATKEFTRIQAQVFAPNVASCRVLEKCGFTKEGVLRQCVCKEGKFYDAVVYGLLASDRGKQHEDHRGQ